MLYRVSLEATVRERASLTVEADGPEQAAEAAVSLAAWGGRPYDVVITGVELAEALGQDLLEGD